MRPIRWEGYLNTASKWETYRYLNIDDLMLRMCLTTLQVEGYTGDNYSVFATDGLFFHSGLEAASVVVWNMDNRQEVGRLEGHDEEAFRIIAARGNIAVSNHDGGPRLWNLQTLQCTATAPAADMEGDYVNTASITGSKLLQGYEGDHGIKVWDIAAAEPIALADLEGHTDGVGCIKSSAVTALSGSGDETMRLWDCAPASVCAPWKGIRALCIQWTWTDSVSKLSAAPLMSRSSCGTWGVGVAWRHMRA